MDGGHSKKCCMCVENTLAKFDQQNQDVLAFQV